MSVIFSQLYRNALTRALTSLSPNQQGFAAGEHYELDGYRFMFRSMVQFTPSTIENGGLNASVVCSYAVQPLPNNLVGLEQDHFYAGYSEYKKTGISPEDLKSFDDEFAAPVQAAVDEALDKFYSDMAEAQLTEPEVVFRSERFLKGLPQEQPSSLILAK